MLVGVTTFISRVQCLVTLWSCSSLILNHVTRPFSAAFGSSCASVCGAVNRLNVAIIAAFSGADWSYFTSLKVHYKRGHCPADLWRPLLRTVPMTFPPKNPEFSIQQRKTGTFWSRCRSIKRRDFPVQQTRSHLRAVVAARNSVVWRKFWNAAACTSSGPIVAPWVTPDMSLLV